MSLLLLLNQCALGAPALPWFFRPNLGVELEYEQERNKLLSDAIDELKAEEPSQDLLDQARLVLDVKRAEDREIVDRLTAINGRLNDENERLTRQVVDIARFEELLAISAARMAEIERRWLEDEAIIALLLSE